jgi:hypothetical protein
MEVKSLQTLASIAVIKLMHPDLYDIFIQDFFKEKGIYESIQIQLKLLKLNVNSCRKTLRQQRQGDLTITRDCDFCEFENDFDLDFEYPDLAIFDKIAIKKLSRSVLKIEKSLKGFESVFKKHKK